MHDILNIIETCKLNLYENYQVIIACESSMFSFVTKIVKYLASNIYILCMYTHHKKV